MATRRAQHQLQLQQQLQLLLQLRQSGQSAACVCSCGSLLQLVAGPSALLSPSLSLCWPAVPRAAALDHRRVATAASASASASAACYY